MAGLGDIRTQTAVVVSEDDGLRQGVASWLEEAGLEVMVCPGPRAPHFTCIGLEGGACPLVAGTDVVLLDLHPEPGELVDNTSRRELLRHYTAAGHRVIAMVDAGASVELPRVAGVTVTERLAERAALVDVVREVLQHPRPHKQEKERGGMT